MFFLAPLLVGGLAGGLIGAAAASDRRSPPARESDEDVRVKLARLEAELAALRAAKAS